MGIKNIVKIIAELVPESMEVVDERTLFTTGESLAIDATYVVHRFAHADPCRHDLAGDLVRKFEPLVRHAPSSVFVFDGTSRPEKAPTKGCRERRHAEERAQLAVAREQLREASAPDEVARLEQLVTSLEKRCVELTSVDIDSVRARFEALGWNVEVAAHDAEQRVAELVRAGRCDAGYTDDSDVIVWGCPVTLIRAGKSRQMTRIALDRVLEGLQLTHSQLVDVALLLGTDFTVSTLAGVGPKRAIPLIKRYGDIEGIVDAHPAKRARVESGEFDYHAGRVIFGHDDL